VAQAVEAEESARKRLSDELHDHAIQNVLTARQDVADALHGDTGALERADRALRLALEQLRSIVRELHPHLLTYLDLPSTLDAIAEQHAARGGYTVKMTIEPAAVGIHDELVVSLVRELLSNIAKHARATRAAVTLTRENHDVALEVTDDGRGFTAERQVAALVEGHIGLASSRERVEASGGRFQIKSKPGSGTRVRCTIPARPSIDARTSDHWVTAQN
jgi:two-component system NarL family sensor kinase